ncbi:MAG: hypothetical protein M1823_002938 [Watsoniomyces obsoletus]|nr:MAG: hypothetical protein M1823_002938 [Watsoniomyces obsoletus]
MDPRSPYSMPSGPPSSDSDDSSRRTNSNASSAENSPRGVADRSVSWEFQEIVRLMRRLSLSDVPRPERADDFSSDVTKPERVDGVPSDITKPERANGVSSDVTKLERVDGVSTDVTKAERVNGVPSDVTKPQHVEEVSSHVTKPERVDGVRSDATKPERVDGASSDVTQPERVNSVSPDAVDAPSAGAIGITPVAAAVVVVDAEQRTATVSTENHVSKPESSLVLGDLVPVLTINPSAHPLPRAAAVKTPLEGADGGLPVSLPSLDHDGDDDDDGSDIPSPIHQAGGVEPVEPVIVNGDSGRPIGVEGPLAVDPTAQRGPFHTVDPYYHQYAQARRPNRKSLRAAIPAEWSPAAAQVPSETGSGIDLSGIDMSIPRQWAPLPLRKTVSAGPSAGVWNLLAPTTPARELHFDTSLVNPKYMFPSTSSPKSRRASKAPQGRSSADRRRDIVLALMQVFPNETTLLLSIPPPLGSSGSGMNNGIHVFVDCSNILIGFSNILKQARNIPETARLPGGRPRFDFTAFALILERKRDVAKRCMVGSDQHQPLIADAEACGYRVEMLQRVARVEDEPASPHRRTNRRGHAVTGSGSETPSRRIRMVEQGVDEMLHLKMTESMLDTTRPSTMVVASGDAAPAQYSGGFLQQVERALTRGWIVEVVSFSQAVSSHYQRPAFRQRWGDQFKLIILDPYAELMLNQ